MGEPLASDRDIAREGTPPFFTCAQGERPRQLQTHEQVLLEAEVGAQESHEGDGDPHRVVDEREVQVREGEEDLGGAAGAEGLRDAVAGTRGRRGRRCGPLQRRRI